MLKIVHYGHPALRWKSKPIQRIDAQLRGIVQEMFALMYEAKGIGLAANQVALPWRLFVLNLTGDAENKEEELVFINPQIVRRKGTQVGEEGCLSMPKLYADVRRADQILVDAFDLQGQGFELEIDELASRAVQHETDHLDGVLFTDRLSEYAQRELSGNLAEFEEEFRRQQKRGEYPADSEIQKQLRELEQ